MSNVDPISADFAARHPDAFARILGRGDGGEIANVLETLAPPSKAAVVARLASPQIDELLKNSEQSPTQWLVDAAFDDAMALLNRLPRERRFALINVLKEGDRRQQLLRHQQFPTHSVGALVSDVAYRIIEDAPVANVLEALREDDVFGSGRHLPVVVDRAGHYVGLLDVWALIVCDTTSEVVRNYIKRVTPVFPDTSVVSAAKNEDWHLYNWLPVVDHRQHLLGGVSRKRVFEAERLYAQSAQGAADAMAMFGADVVRVLGALLDSLLARKSST